MDCNSIIYDAVHTLEKTEPSDNHALFEQKIISIVIVKIREYITTISPSNVVYIAFDGVAPFAKMEQQRTRRYKTAFMSLLNLENEQSPISTEPSSKWNTSAITPGTQFMKTLSDKINREFQQSLFTNIRNVIVSASDEPGEGEHKMFQYMRDNVPSHENVAVYGLDSDLIMLSIFHSFLCKNIFICREAPQFSKKILPTNIQYGTNELLFLDTQLLSLSILNEMGCGSIVKHSHILQNNTEDKDNSRMRIYDYVFMCFLLGNDFLPHFPAINIRRNGIQQLMDIYSLHIGKYHDRGFISKDTMKIQWKWVKLFFSEIAKLEHRFLVEEYTFRNKMSNSKCKHGSTKEEILERIPIENRGDEHYICPTEEGWESRYYRIVTGSPASNETIAKMSKNYIEGLEWVFRYYTEGCPHWQWKYNYNYPPLFNEIVKHIPSSENVTLLSNYYAKNTPFNPQIQLLYVIPYIYHPTLLQQNTQKISKQYPEYFIDIKHLTFQWMFCSYLWEAHVHLPEIPLSILHQWESELVKPK
jgi:5'-3' exonuclease